MSTDSNPSAFDFVQQAITERVARVQQQAEPARAQDIDGVHDLRVASRRLRAAVKLFKSIAEYPSLTALAAQARQITQGLGRSRELDVMIGFVVREHKEATGPWRDALTAIEAALRACRAETATATACVAAGELAEALAMPMLAPGTADAVELPRFARHALRRGLKKLWRAHKHWQRDPHGHALHEVRIAFKKFRYTCEVLAPLVPGLEAFIAELKSAQEALGDWNDLRVLVREIEDLALTVPTPEAQNLARTAFVAREAAYLEAFRQQAAGFFTRANRKRIRAIFDAAIPQGEHPVSYTPLILALAGSLRAGSFNSRILHIAAEAAREAGAEVKVIDLREFPLPIYDGDLEAAEGLPANVMALKREFLAHEGLLLASPEYNSSFTPLMKNTIDWVSRPAPGEGGLAAYKGKTAVLMSASPGALGGLRGLVHLRAVLGNIGVIVLPEQKAISSASAAFTPEGALANAKDQDAIRALGTRLAEVLGKLHAS